MKFITISDTHNKHKLIPKEWMEPADCIIHSGDVSSRGYVQEVKEFLQWFSALDQYEHKVFIAGNHDFGFERFNQGHDEIMRLLREEFPNVTYLKDDFVVIEGIKIYGSPWQPEFFNWAFNLRRGAPLRDKWNNIPEDTDILITHGPAHGILDMAPSGEFVGCEDLLDVITTRLRIKAHICGHIHGAAGTLMRNGTQFINASTLNERYEVAYKPTIFTI